MTDYTVSGTDGRRLERNETVRAESPVTLAKLLHDAGWREADITIDGRLVGQVTRDLNANRTWWGEKADHQPQPAKRTRVRSGGRR